MTEGDDLEIKLGFVDGEDQGTVFKGEVVGVEPIYDSRAPARVHIRGLNRLHRLARGRKSQTFEKMTDQDIVTRICQKAGLKAVCYGDPAIKHDHVYQHNLTDLEFIRMRAARLDFEVGGRPDPLFPQARRQGFRRQARSGRDGSALERFSPRMSSAQQVEVKVIVRGWDPVKAQGDRRHREAAVVRSASSTAPGSARGRTGRLAGTARISGLVAGGGGQDRDVGAEVRRWASSPARGLSRDSRAQAGHHRHRRRTTHASTASTTSSPSVIVR